MDSRLGRARGLAPLHAHPILQRTRPTSLGHRRLQDEQGRILIARRSLVSRSSLEDVVLVRAVCSLWLIDAVELIVVVVVAQLELELDLQLGLCHPGAILVVVNSSGSPVVLLRCCTVARPPAG